MPALPSVAPEVLKKILEKYAFDVCNEDAENWVLVREEEGVLPTLLTIPKQGKKVALDIMSDALDKAKMNNATYFRLLAEVQGILTGQSSPIIEQENT